MRECIKCKIEKELSEFYYHRQRKYYMSTCKTCNNKTSMVYHNTLKEINPVDSQLRSRASEIVRRSKHKKLPYDKKMYQVLKELYNEQKGLCYYTHLPLDHSGYQDSNPYCFVVDRKIPENGYVKDNMVFSCNAINKIKSTFSIDELKWWVNQIK